jgi:photosystem II stability/assembly factor-like uncharacterized protein
LDISTMTASEAPNREDSTVDHRTSQTRTRRALPGISVLLAATAVLSTGCADTTPAPAAPPAATSTPAASGMAHLHALGVDPADGVLYAASHHGLYRIRAGSPAELVGGTTQDTMGFVVAGPGHFLGSGHPAPGENKPANLGFIESKDAGATWTSVSLSGQVDFHSMDVKKGQIFGYDSQSGQLMVSTDGTTWDRRARITIGDIAVNPDDPIFVIAVTQKGLAHSADGGRTFRLLNNTPALGLLDWSPGNAIVGVDKNGSVAASADHGATWAKLGTVPGTPQALAVHGDKNIYVATDKGIYSSTDAGGTFTLLQPLT